MTSARDQALEAMDRPEAKFQMAPIELDLFLQTIPAHVLALLAKERDGLQHVGYVAEDESEEDHIFRYRLNSCRIVGSDDEPVYRIVEATQ